VVVLYRTVHHNPPLPEDFRSGKEMGIQKPNRSKELYWLGFSAYDSLERASDIAERFPRQGDYVAEFTVPDAASTPPDTNAFTLPAAGSITIMRSFGPGHWTVWGFPDLFPPLVRRVTVVPR